MYCQSVSASILPNEIKSLTLKIMVLWQSDPGSDIFAYIK